MKKLFLFVVMLGVVMVTAPSFSADTNTYATSNTVSFNTVGTIVTFNSAIRSVSISNHSNSGGNLYITLWKNGIGWDAGQTTYTLPASTMPGATLVKPGQTLNADIATKYIGYKCDEGTGTITYVAVSDKAQ